jgi:hypothetical protein
VRNTKRAWRWHRSLPLAEELGVNFSIFYVNSNAIQKAEALHFRQVVADAAR